MVGSYSQDQSGTDTYSMAETGSNTGGTYSEGVTGTDTYSQTETGNPATGYFSRTVSGHATYDRTDTGPGASFLSGTGTIYFGLQESGSSRSGSFTLSETGTDRYHLLEAFNDVSNTGGGRTPGNVDFHPFGLPFVDPSIEPAVDLGKLGFGQEDIHRFQVWWNTLNDAQRGTFNTRLTSLKDIVSNPGSQNPIVFTAQQRQRSEIQGKLNDLYAADRAARKPAATKSLTPAAERTVSPMDALRFIATDMIGYYEDALSLAKGFLQGLPKGILDLLKGLGQLPWVFITDPTGLNKALAALKAIEKLKKIIADDPEGGFDKVVRQLLPGFYEFFMPPDDFYTNREARNKWQERRGEFLGKQAGILLAPAALAKAAEYLMALRAAFKAARAAGLTEEAAAAKALKDVPRPKELGPVVNAPNKMPSADAQQIAKGHAWGKHKAEFPEFSTEAEFAQHIDQIISNPSASKNLAKGRKAFWDDKSKTVVIRDPGSPDLGTAFKPKDGKMYFDNLK